jgi:transposase-like protein
VTSYKRHRFPPAIIQHAVWLYHRFNLSHRDIEDILARRGVLVTHESIRLWCNKFGLRYANNRAELSHQPTRVRERGMRRFKSMMQAERFVRVHAAVSNLFNVGRHLVAAAHFRTLRQSSFASWDRAVAI